MKKFFLIIIVVLTSCVAASATQLTPAQKKAKTEIFNALKRYATNIQDTGDEDMSFKYDGTTYFASVHAQNPTTLYLSLTGLFSLPEGFDPVLANEAAYQAGGGKPVCTYSTGKIAAFSCEMYTKDVKSFIAVIPEMLEALSSSADSFLDEYHKLESEQVSANTGLLPGDVRVFDHPQIASKVDRELSVEKVTLTPEATILDMKSYNGGMYQWCSIDKNSYITANGKRLYLTNAEGIALAPEHTNYPRWFTGNNVSLSFKLYFPPLPAGTTSFDFSEGPDGWWVKGIELKEGGNHKEGMGLEVQDANLETEYYRWSISGIDIQDGQTILYKSVIPKERGTYMYSTKKEFIEDAETGLRFYLQSSSLGLEDTPQVSYDTNPITFYEVYPVLPSHVKYINISSGTQYYVKRLKIR